MHHAIMLLRFTHGDRHLTYLFTHFGCFSSSKKCKSRFLSFVWKSIQIQNHRNITVKTINPLFVSTTDFINSAILGLLRILRLSSRRWLVDSVTVYLMTQRGRTSPAILDDSAFRFHNNRPCRLCRPWIQNKQRCIKMKSIYWSLLFIIYYRQIEVVVEAAILTHVL